jgi:hypothetical protein
MNKKLLCGINSTRLALLLGLIICCSQINAQGTWTPLNNTPSDSNVGVMLLLSDGTVISKTHTGGIDGYGIVWDKLTPDSNGSYINGTWSQIAPMNDSRLYFSSEVLKDGRVFVAGGEYGTGGSSAEVYDPITDTWTMAPNEGQYLGDANSEILPDGKVLEAVLGVAYYDDSTIIYDPVANKWGAVSVCHGYHAESSWLKLKDNSILFVDDGGPSTLTSERYIPSLNKWVKDANTPDSIYDNYAYESGPFLLLPDGRGFIMGATGHTAYYTPSGTVAPGTWTKGPDIPNHYGAADAPGAMMINGKILCTASPTPDSVRGYFPSPTAYFEFDYTTNSFTQISAPTGGDTVSEPCFFTNMLDLPDGTVLYSDQYSPYYYIYTPSGKPLAAGKPTITNVTQKNCVYTITGTLFNGISQGADYGDDWQMFTNYPIIRLRLGNKIYYARTFNWNSTAVQTGSMPDTAEFTVPGNVPNGTYWLYVSANGISSDSVAFVYKSCTTGIDEMATSDFIHAYPNPASKQVDITFKLNDGGNYMVSLTDIYGRVVKQENATAIAGNNTHSIDLDGFAEGVYMIVLQKGNEIYKSKLVVK